jgi:PAS domain S-box-containing protein
MAAESAYELKSLREGTDFTLYRGTQRGNPLPILAVVVASEPALAQNLGRLKHEYSLATDLDAAWAAQPLALTHHQGRAMLILKDPGGEPLDRILEQQCGQPLELTRLLVIAIGLTAALSQAHRQGLIHRDVKPANVMVDEAGRVWLTGFGVASKALRERLAPAPAQFIAGSLAYMSPEQTGRMNRSIDARSDLYSLGVILYEMLTGALPFTAADTLEWVHCHIARQPVAPADRRAVPAPLSAMITRLLAKNAQDRYQTAAGLEADLRRCLSQWQSQGRIDPFPLGENDLSERLLVPETLYGREREVDALLAAFDRMVAQGAPELVLVSGYSGVGKSSVVNELHKVLVPLRGLFAAGKFDQYKRDVPYATLAQAFQVLVRQILVKSQAEVDQWRQTLLEALGPNGQLIIPLVPDVEFVIGKQPPVPELEPREARGRFQWVLRRFLGAFARPEHPLVLFLDDLQWLDLATLDWLEQVLTDPGLGCLLLIGAYRDNEVSASHPLMRTLTTIREAGVRPRQIVLAPLGLDDIERLTADALHCGTDLVGPLALLVYAKTGGNPFFALQFLTALAEEGLLRFDRGRATWISDLDGIRTKDYSDNVVDLMLGKLRRLPPPTQSALQLLACLGNVTDSALLSLASGQSQEALQAPLWEAVRNGLILRVEKSYAFLHDRIQEAAYALIPAETRAEQHLRIGRKLLAGSTAAGLAEHLFDVANQLNRGASLLIDEDEKRRVAAIDLEAGRRAKASAAYGSAREYFAIGLTLLGEDESDIPYELGFSLALECAECALLCGNLEAADQLLEELLPRARSKIDEAAVYHLKVHLHLLRSEILQTVDTALACLRGFGIELPRHPTEEQVRAEYEAVWEALDGRTIESLIDLPLMTDRELQAAVSVMSLVNAPAYFVDFRLFCLLACHIVKVSIRLGMSAHAANAFCNLGVILGSVFHRYNEGYRFARLACALVDRHDFTAVRAKVQVICAVVAGWTQPVEAAIDLAEAGFRAAREGGDPAFGCYAMSIAIMYRHLRNDPLEVVWRESEMAMDFARTARYEDGAVMFVVQQRLIATLQGRTTSLSTFSDGQFDESEFEAQLAGGNPTVTAWYRILKLKARFLSGDFAEALTTAGEAQKLLWCAIGRIEMLEYVYYHALTLTALYEAASSDTQQAWRKLLAAHREQLQEWADHHPPTFGDKLALVSAEIARIETRHADALRLYEEAIRSARNNGFVQNEALAHELAARCCLAQRLDTAAYAHLRSARSGYERWGAHAKVGQLDQDYPRLREGRTPAASAAIPPPVGTLDVETVGKASQALSGEMVLPVLIQTLMRIVVENAGAQRGVLVMVRDGEPRIEAEATSRSGRIEVEVRHTLVTDSDLPQAALLYVFRTHERVLLDDASTDPLYAKDEYVRHQHPRSVLCLPIVKQGTLMGALYLENNLTPGAFTPGRVTVLQLLASQAAISLENAYLYSNLELQAGLLQRLPVSAWTLEPDGTPDFVNQVWLDYSGQTLDFIRSHPEAWMTAIHPEDREAASKIFRDGVRAGQGFAFETRSLRAGDGTYRWHLQQAVVLRDAQGKVLKFVGTTTDIDDQKRVEDALRQAQGDLARINRVTTMGELAASLAHELGQPIGAIMTNADASLLRLDRSEPDVVAARAALQRIVRDTDRAAAIIGRVRSQFTRGTPIREFLDLNEITRETIALLRDEATRYHMSVRTELAPGLPQIVGDRVQLQQVMMNLIINSIEAMKDVAGIRDILIRTQQAEQEQLLLSISDTGTGFAPHLAEQIFDPFFSTKPQGTGMGLRISRSIIESHGGRLWAVGSLGHGATFHLNLPVALRA